MGKVAATVKNNLLLILTLSETGVSPTPFPPPISVIV